MRQEKARAAKPDCTRRPNRPVSEPSLQRVPPGDRTVTSTPPVRFLRLSFMMTG